jgi:hypothetical protein
VAKICKIINDKYLILYIIRMGTSDRFGKMKFHPVPGPGNYKIDGFTDLLLKDVDRYLKNNMKLKMDEFVATNNKKSKEIVDGGDISSEVEVESQ